MKMDTMERNEQTGVLEQFFFETWQKGKPIAALFKTTSMHYLYDTGSNKVLQCESHVYNLLEYLLSLDVKTAIIGYKGKFGVELFIDAAMKIKDAVESEGILLSTGAIQFGLGDHYGKFVEQIAHSLGMITLEITENCNLRCDYCLYNPHVEHAREHTAKEMTLETALKGIDYLKQHSSNKKKVAITFYGGEPLLRFDFIRLCVSYAQSIFKDKKLEFSLTTNGTCFTPEIVEYLYKKRFTVIVSIDGPEEIHDSNRRDIHGKGSFLRAIAGLKMLVEQYKEKASERILLSMVYAPPFSENKINRIASLWDEYPWIPKSMGVNITYPSEGTLSPGKYSAQDLEEDKELNDWGIEMFKQKYSGVKEIHPIASSIEEKKLAMFMQRRIFNSPFDKYFLNGCCLPGVRKLFISTDGTFRVCEKISFKAPVIGNVSTGIDVESIKKNYIDEYENQCLPICSKCWAIRLCSLCYIHGFDKGNIDINKKLRACGAEKFLKAKLIKLFAALTENDPSALDYLYDFKLE